MALMSADTHVLGRTGLDVSRVGLGLAAVGRPAYITLGRAADLGMDRSVEAMRARSLALLDTAYAGGVRYVDAARSYGRAEEFLGAWLHANPAAGHDLVVGSKWGYRYTGAWRLDATVQEVKDLGVDNLRRQFAESREFLDDHLRLYQIHSATVESGVLEDEAVLADLRLIKDAGIAIGLTVTGPNQSVTIERALARSCSTRFRRRGTSWNAQQPERSRRRTPRVWASLSKKHSPTAALPSRRMASHPSQPSARASSRLPISWPSLLSLISHGLMSFSAAPRRPNSCAATWQRWISGSTRTCVPSCLDWRSPPNTTGQSAHDSSGPDESSDDGTSSGESKLGQPSCLSSQRELGLVELEPGGGPAVAVVVAGHRPT